MKSVRTTFSLSQTHHEDLQQLARVSGVSISWIVRHAISDFLVQHKDKGFNPLVRLDNPEDKK
ncbi:ribbon-helix-helix domain-containing protein [Vibrio splendidus]